MKYFLQCLNLAWLIFVGCSDHKPAQTFSVNRVTVPNASERRDDNGISPEGSWTVAHLIALSESCPFKFGDSAKKCAQVLSENSGPPHIWVLMGRPKNAEELFFKSDRESFIVFLKVQNDPASDLAAFECLCELRFKDGKLFELLLQQGNGTLRLGAAARLIPSSFSELDTHGSVTTF